MVFMFLMLIVGGGSILVGLYHQKQNKALEQACTVQTPGVVVRIDKDVKTETYTDHEEEDERRKTKTREVTWYYSVFEYSAGERTYTKKGSTGTGNPKFRVGEQITIFYNPDNPDEFYAAEDKSSDFLGKFAIIFGSVIVVAGIVVAFL